MSLVGCRDAWQPDVCMTIAQDCPSENLVQEVPNAAERGEWQTCHGLDSVKYLEVPEWISDASNEPDAQVSVPAGTSDGQAVENRKMENRLNEERKRTGVSVERKQVAERGAEPAGVQDAVADSCVDINLADEKGLARLPGIGAGKAKAIVAAREKRPFKRKKDITRIKGIGPKSYQRMAGMICEIVPR